MKRKKENKNSEKFFLNKINREKIMKKLNSEIVREIAEIAEKENFEFNSKFDYSFCTRYSKSTQPVSDWPLYLIRRKNSNEIITIKFVNKVFQLKEEILKIGMEKVIEKYKIVE